MATIYLGIRIATAAPPTVLPANLPLPAQLVKMVTMEKHVVIRVEVSALPARSTPTATHVLQDALTHTVILTVPKDVQIYCVTRDQDSAYWIVYTAITKMVQIASNVQKAAKDAITTQAVPGVILDSTALIASYYALTDV